jgi:thiol:disulfide interchange protein/DsbC/DsbD-like thiol-disulfide interchange protein
MNMILSRFLAVCLGLLMGFSAQGAATTARLVLPVETVKPGDTITVGVMLEMPPGWHTYWKNPGESGMASKIIWTLPEGITAGDIQWPTPEVYEDKTVDLTTYVHHDQAMLLVPLTVGADTTSGELNLKARVSWLECEKLCVPGRADITGKLKVGAETKLSSDAPLIQEWQAKLPKPNPTLKATARWDGPIKEDSRKAIIEFSPDASAANWDFYPYRGDDFTISPKSERIGLLAGRYTLRKTVTSDEGKWPTVINGLIVDGSNPQKPGIAYEAAISLGGTPSTSAVSTSGKIDGDSASAQPEIAPRSLVAMLIYAFIGGTILNIMPCVLPVISLKILGFVHQSQQDPKRVRMLGLVYALGVVVSFLVLAGLVIGVQQAGKAASWGMQFQNPQFLVVLTILVTLVALNLFGVFEVTMNSNVMGAAGQLAAQKGPSGAFFNGVLATILATPCTAPFLGVALGFAFAQSAAVILLVFVTIALGLAFPYVLLSWQPKWLKFLPKPGAWMERFKILMGFPMIATAIWLFSLSAGHFGRSGVLWIGLLLVFVGLAAYIFGEFVQRGSKHRGVSAALAGILLLGSLGYILEGQLNWRSPDRGGTSATTLESKVGIEWKSWNVAAVEEARKSGKPVFVDFTADWCVTCQANKRTSIEITSVKKKLDAIGAVSLLGDYTYEDAAIAAELKKYGRAGVPLVVVFPADPQAKPIVLPELLTPGIVLEALEKAAPKQLSSVK